MGVGAAFCVYDVVLKSSRSLSHLLMSSYTFHWTQDGQEFHYDWIFCVNALIFSESSRSLYAIARPSVCRL